MSVSNRSMIQFLKINAQSQCPSFLRIQTTGDDYGDFDLVIKFWFSRSTIYFFTSGYNGLGTELYFFWTGWWSFKLISISRSGIQPISSSLNAKDSYSSLNLLQLQSFDIDSSHSDQLLGEGSTLPRFAAGE